MIRIITDSLSDLTMEFARENNFDIMPLTVRFGKTDYVCGVDMLNEEFYDKLENYPEPPTTAAVNPYDFEQIFRRYVDAGDEIVAILFSKYMSATFQSASIAAENIDSPHIRLIDCETGAMGQALLILTALGFRDSGMTADEIEERIRGLLPKTKTFFVVDNMEYLQRGGRISKSAEQVSSQMKVHPVLELLADGVKPVDKVKGRKSCHLWLQNKLQESDVDENYKIVIGHSNAPDRAESFRQQLAEAGITNEIAITCIAPIVGTHIGPNSLGIGYIEK